MLDQLTILYTQNLHGDLNLLPRLQRFLQGIKATLTTPFLLLDIGGACHADVWHCQVTKGRSSLIVLDAMGYHVVNVMGFLSADERIKLAAQTTLGLVDEQHVWRYHVPPLKEDGLIVAAQPSPALQLCIVARPAEKTNLEQRELSLVGITKGQVGKVLIDLVRLDIVQSDILSLTPTIKADPTIAATVEFVEEEARFYQSKQER